MGMNEVSKTLGNAFNFSVSEDIQNLIPYKPGKPISETLREYKLEKVIKLASNENPLGPSLRVEAALHKAIPWIHQYPDPQCYDLKNQIHQSWDVPLDQMTFGNGSDELIDLLIRTFCDRGDQIITSNLAFISYELSAQASHVGVIRVPMTAELTFDLPKMAEEILKNPSIKLAFIANPNNPTGTFVSINSIQVFLETVKSRENLICVFDEAYVEFLRASEAQSVLSLLQKYPQVCVLRTFSKTYGLAGLRMGALFSSQPQIINYVNKVRKAFNVNMLAQVAAVAALQDTEYIRRSQELVWGALDYFYGALQEMGLPYWESQANFVLFDCKRDSGSVYMELLKKGVILRPLANYGCPTYLRMSVGLPSENILAIEALKEVLI